MKAYTKAIEYIRAIDNHAEMREVIDAIKLQQTFIGNKTIRQLAVGDRVCWNGKHGANRGTVRKVNRKYVMVDTATGQWRVPATMLTKEVDYA